MNENHRLFPGRPVRSSWLSASFVLLMSFVLFILPLATPLFGEEAPAGEARGEDLSIVQAFSITRKYVAMNAATDDGVDFTVRFMSNGSTDRMILVNTTDHDTEKWEVSFSQSYFKVKIGEPVDVVVNIKTNYSAINYYQEISVGIFGDEYRNGNDTGLDSNTVTLQTFVAKAHDPIVSFEASEENRTVTHKKETAFHFTLRNMGYDAGIPDVHANVFDGTKGWRVRVMPGPDIGVPISLGSLESKDFTVNVTSPNNIKTGAYEIEVIAQVGGSGYGKFTVFAYVPRPDLSIRVVDSDHSIAFVKSEVKLRAIVQNDGGKANNIEVNFYLRDINGNLIPVGTRTITTLTNYNTTTVSIEWTTIKIAEERPTENFTILAEVDPEGKIWETDEGNNEGEGVLEVRRTIKKEPSFMPPVALMMLMPLVLLIGYTAIYRKLKPSCKDE